MPNPQVKLSMAQLLSALQAAQLAAAEDAQQISGFLRERLGRESLSFPLRFMAGLGALIAAACLISFLAAAHLIDLDSHASMAVAGLILAGAGLAWYNLRGVSYGSLRASFAAQLSFCFVAAGKLLFAAGWTLGLESGWGASLALLFATAATYHVYPLAFERFLSSCALLLSVLFNLMFASKLFMPASGALNLLLVFQLAVLGRIICGTGVRRDYFPIAYACAVGLCAQLLFCGLDQHLVKSATWERGVPSLILSFSFLALIVWAAGGLRHAGREAVAAAFLGVALLGALPAPGVVLALGLMVLGHAAYDLNLVGWGAFFMPVFIAHYYYSLEATLLQKSFILVGSGLVLLAGRWYAARRCIPGRGA